MNKAYTNHFRRPDHFDEPQFKSKKKSKKSYTSALTNNNIRIEGKLIKLPKLGYVRIKMHRQLPKDSKITSVTVSKSASGKYYVSLTSTYEIEDINRKLEYERKIRQMDMETLMKIKTRQNARKEFKKSNRPQNNAPTGIQ